MKNGEKATIDWLLEESDPSVRFFTLTSLLGESPAGAKAAAARKALMREGPVADILSRQGAEGCWGKASEFYTDKYGGTVWQLLTLAELGADGSDPRVRAAREFILVNSQDPESGGFSVNSSVKTGGGRHGEVIPCLTGNMVYSLASLGFAEDARVGRAVDWICEYQRADDGGAGPPSIWPYDRMGICFGRHSCFMGVVKSLKALAALLAGKRSRRAEAKIRELSEFLLVHRIHKRSHDPERLSKPGWLKYGFPLMYQTDSLEILLILTRLGVRDPRMDEAVELLRSKRRSDGRWKLENSFNGKTLVDIERKGEASKWITARALWVLDAYGA